MYHNRHRSTKILIPKDSKRVLKIPSIQALEKNKIQIANQGNVYELKSISKLYFDNKNKKIRTQTDNTKRDFEPKTVKTQLTPKSKNINPSNSLPQLNFNTIQNSPSNYNYYGLKSSVDIIRNHPSVLYSIDSSNFGRSDNSVATRGFHVRYRSIEPEINLSRIPSQNQIKQIRKNEQKNTRNIIEKSQYMRSGGNRVKFIQQSGFQEMLKSESFKDLAKNFSVKIKTSKSPKELRQDRREQAKKAEIQNNRSRKSNKSRGSIVLANGIQDIKNSKEKLTKIRQKIYSMPEQQLQHDLGPLLQSDFETRQQYLQKLQNIKQDPQIYEMQLKNKIKWLTEDLPTKDKISFKGGSIMSQSSALRTHNYMKHMLYIDGKLDDDIQKMNQILNDQSIDKKRRKDKNKDRFQQLLNQSMFQK